MRDRRPTTSLSYAEVDEIVRSRLKEESFALENALLDYLGSEQIQRVSTEALARYSAQYRLDRMGYGEQIIALIAEEQERRHQASSSHSQRTADSALTWSRLSTLAAVVAAVVAAVAAIAVLFK